MSTQNDGSYNKVDAFASKVETSKQPTFASNLFIPGLPPEGAAHSNREFSPLWLILPGSTLTGPPYMTCLCTFLTCVHACTRT